MQPTSTTSDPPRQETAAEIVPLSQEEYEAFDALTDEEVCTAASDDPDAVGVHRLRGPYYQSRAIRIREDLLEWFDNHPRAWLLVNELLDGYRAEESGNDAALADQLDAIAGHLRARAERQRQAG